MAETLVRKRRKLNRYALHALRLRERLTQDALAGLAGIDHSFISHLERGSRYSCPVEVAERLAEALRVPAEALYAAD